MALRDILVCIDGTAAGHVRFDDETFAAIERAYYELGQVSDGTCGRAAVGHPGRGPVPGGTSGRTAGQRRRRWHGQALARESRTAPAGTPTALSCAIASCFVRCRVRSPKMLNSISPKRRVKATCCGGVMC
jgi:hypothetical protein